MEKNGPYTWNKMAPIHGKKWPLYMEQNGPYKWKKLAPIHGTKWPLYMEQNGPYTWCTKIFKDTTLFLTFNI